MEITTFPFIVESGMIAEIVVLLSMVKSFTVLPPITNLVISDIQFLKTLPNREVICGYGEILKHSLIANKNFYKFLEKCDII